MSVDKNGTPVYPTSAPWAEWIDRHMRCVGEGRYGRCQLVTGHDQPHAVVLLLAVGKRAWRWDENPAVDAAVDPAVDPAADLVADPDAPGWVDDGGPWGNVATDRAPWIPGWP